MLSTHIYVFWYAHLYFYSPYSLIGNDWLGVNCIVSDSELQKGPEIFNLVHDTPCAHQSVFGTTPHAAPFLQGFRGNSKVVCGLLFVEYFLDYCVVHIVTHTYLSIVTV